ncbi:MAG: NFACT family protein [Vulcanibacillus sp.]
MALDGFVVRALVEELSQELTNQKISKIYQPHHSDLYFNIRGYGKATNLLLSANPTYPRVYIPSGNSLNPMEPPMFCMLLRKHLEGGIISKISQIDNERIIHIDINMKDEIGDTHQKRLIIELMGKHSNIILVNQDNIILDGINHVTAAISRHRQVLPGKLYIDPPSQNKLNPFLVDKDQFFSKITFNDKKIEKQLVDNFSGMSPAIAKEIFIRSDQSTMENLWKSYSELITQIKNKEYQHTIISGEEKEDFSIINLTYLIGRTKTYARINECMDEFYKNKAEKDSVKQRTLDLSKFMNNEKQKNDKKIENLLKDLDESNNSEQNRLYGELITASLHQISKGNKEVKVTNYYSENQNLITITLDPLKSPIENAQAYFKKYSKLKNSKRFIDLQLIKTKEENDYIDTILTQIDNASLGDIEEIREELIEQGYLKARKNKNQRKKKKEPVLLKLISSEGIPIYVGKNNIQNEYLTNKFASPFETWLHTKDIPGSHVLIKATEFGDTTLLEAAMLACYYSKAKASSKVPVDYTLVKYVKKPNGAKPGFVIYERQKTVYITPDETLIEQLKANQKSESKKYS